MYVCMHVCMYVRTYVRMYVDSLQHAYMHMAVRENLAKFGAAAIAYHHWFHLGRPPWGQMDLSPVYHLHIHLSIGRMWIMGGYPRIAIQKLHRQETPNSVGSRKSMYQIQATAAMKQ